ncbi:ammonium transporter [Mycena alexandri]|uniref:Ammonium transporter n=1 Tax=Mycena alexandri TaxID=1745969 RepID=A0AAD6T2C6_9AGAR|nr:ammonium transporter [Mycena alexandri]
MPNLTYDASGDLVVTDPTDGSTIVYNMGDIAWVLASYRIGLDHGAPVSVSSTRVFYGKRPLHLIQTHRSQLFPVRRKNALSMIYLSMMTIAVVSFQWFFWGFSLAFSEGANLFIGDLKHFALRGVLEKPSIGSAKIPSIVFCVYQLMFAAITHGWSFVHGSYDFAGGTPVHISSGTAALAISIYLGKRRGYGTEALAYKPHNTTYVILGTLFLWFGWFGFNGGSALSANIRAASACIVTNLAASVGGLTWMAWDYRIEKKWSAVGFCSGAIAGLVAITPGIRFRTVCNFATQIKFFAGYDDSLDVFASHAVGGIVASPPTDGFTVIPGGWLDRHWIQLAWHVADSCAGLAYSFVMTTIILWIMHYIPGMRLRVSEETEDLGIDEVDMGEYAYDYVGLEDYAAARRQPCHRDRR